MNVKRKENLNMSVMQFKTASKGKKNHFSFYFKQQIRIKFPVANI